MLDPKAGEPRTSLVYQPFDPTVRFVGHSRVVEGMPRVHQSMRRIGYLDSPIHRDNGLRVGRIVRVGRVRRVGRVGRVVRVGRGEMPKRRTRLER